MSRDVYVRGGYVKGVGMSRGWLCLVWLCLGVGISGVGGYALPSPGYMDPGIRSTGGRYTSYWNAVLLFYSLPTFFHEWNHSMNGLIYPAPPKRRGILTKAWSVEPAPAESGTARSPRSSSLQKNTASHRHWAGAIPARIHERLRHHRKRGINITFPHFTFYKLK